jgi:hypothetical protein
MIASTFFITYSPFAAVLDNKGATSQQQPTIVLQTGCQLHATHTNLNLLDLFIKH